MIKLMNAVLLFIITLLMQQCIMVAGGSSDHGNAKIAGRIEDTDGVPVSGICVMLLPSTYNPITDDRKIVKETISDNNGCFIFEELDSGEYCVSGNNPGSNKSFIKKTSLSDSQFVLLDSIRLNYPGMVIVKGDSVGLKMGMYTYIPGLLKYQEIDSTGCAIMENVPTGIISLKGYSPEEGKNVSLGSRFDNLEIAPMGIFVSIVSAVPYYYDENFGMKTSLNGYLDIPYMISLINPDEAYSSVGYMYRFSWGDGNISEWSDRPMQYYSWKKSGTYHVQSQVKYLDRYYAWSNPLYVTISVN